ncbi:methyltransferase domain-containing protein [Bacteroidota bacterium]
MNKEILLPGLAEQYRLLVGNTDLKNKRVLVMGTGSEEVAKRISVKSGNEVDLIIEDYESLMNTKLILKDTKGINLKIMNFEHTDFSNNTFDVVYAQASINNKRRNNILKEIKRILKNEGFLCVGEIINLKKKVPRFVEMIYDISNQEPLFDSELTRFYVERDFECIFEKDFSDTLKVYYKQIIEKLSAIKQGLSEKEKTKSKKLLVQIAHESKSYLQQGANKFIGYKVLLLKRRKIDNKNV